MINQPKHTKIPSSLIPHCPKCGTPMTMNLRCDQTFVQDDGWYQAQSRYEDFLEKYQDSNILYLELGVGLNTPVIIKYPFWNYTNNKHATYACINLDNITCPREIRKQSILVDEDIDLVIQDLLIELEV